MGLVHLVMALALAAAAPQDSGPPPAAPPAAERDDQALSRIRQALARARRPLLHITLPEPTFRVEITEPRYYIEAPRLWDIGGPGVPLSAPRSGPAGRSTLIKFDTLPLLRAARKALADKAPAGDAEQAPEPSCSTAACGSR